MKTDCLPIAITVVFVSALISGIMLVCCAVAAAVELVRRVMVSLLARLNAAHKQSKESL